MTHEFFFFHDELGEILVEVGYQGTNQCVYDSPFGPLGHEIAIDDIHILSITSETGKDLIDKLTDSSFAQEVWRQIYLEHDNMAQKVGE